MNDIFSYNKITPGIISEIEDKIGAHNVSAEAEKLESYSHDEVPANAYEREYRAALLVFPESTAHVSEIMKIASRERIPVTPRGAGTGLSGGALPVHGGIVMSFEKMNKISEIDEANLTVTTAPGECPAEISRAAAARGLLYAGDPCSGDASFIGGNIAENAGGNKVIKYGATGAQVLALECVMADGSVTQFGGKRRNHQRCSASEIAGGHTGSLQPALFHSDHGASDFRPGAHFYQFPDSSKPVFKHGLPHNCPPGKCGRRGKQRRLQVCGKSGIPGGFHIGHSLPDPAAVRKQCITCHPVLSTHFPVNLQNRLHFLHRRSAEFQVSPDRSSGHKPCSRRDPVRRHTECGSVKLFSSANHHAPARFSLHGSTHTPQEPAEPLYFRLCGTAVQNRCSFRTDRGKNRVFRRPDAFFRKSDMRS